MLDERPLATAGVFAVVASFPLFFAGGFAVRLQDDLQISKSQFGLTISAYFITSAIGSFTIGSLIDRWGTKASFALASVGGSLAALLVATSSSFWTLAFALAVAGISNTSGQLGGNRVLATLEQSRKGFGFGLKQGSVPLGSLIAGAVIGTFNTSFDWRAAFVAYAVVAFATLLIIPDHDGEAATREPRRPVGADWPYLLALAVAGFLGGAAGNGLAVLTVDSFAEAGFSEGDGALALAIGSVVTIITRTWIGWFAGRRASSGFIELGAAMAVGSIGFLLLFLSRSNEVLVWAGSAIAFIGAWGWPGVMYYTVVQNATTTPGTATGFVITGVFMGGIAGAPVLATIAESSSYGSAWLTATVAGTVAVGLVFLASRLSAEQGHRQDKARTAALR